MEAVGREAGALREVLESLDAVRLEKCGAPLGVLPELRKRIGLDALIFVRVDERASGWALQTFEADGVPFPVRVRRALTSVLGEPGTKSWTRINGALLPRVLAPHGLGDLHLLSKRLVDNGVVRGWLGGLTAAAANKREARLLDELVQPLTARLHVERLLTGALRTHAALEATLQQIGAPALLVDRHGRIHEKNRAARDLLGTRADQVGRSLAALISDKTPELPFTLTPLGLPEGEQYLAVLRSHSNEARLHRAVTLAGVRWKLTPRQGEVLGLVVKGASNAEIARRLKISARATELHVTAIFDRTGAVNRAQLVSAVLVG